MPSEEPVWGSGALLLKGIQGQSPLIKGQGNELGPKSLANSYSRATEADDVLFMRGEFIKRTYISNCLYKLQGK